MERLSNQLLQKTSRKTKDRDKKELNEEKIEFITEKKGVKTNCKRELLSRKHRPKRCLDVGEISRKSCGFWTLKQPNYGEI